mmetsp:Transcript_22409/g.33407  ORF Transcript_22409/g.33407 Transcript_22409/m.33407 type:complete len:822 (-) Transcript_22409:315-2780(-)
MDSATRTRSPVYTKRTKSQIRLGEPLDGYVSPNRDVLDQQKEYNKFYEDVQSNYFSLFSMKDEFQRSAYREEQSRNGINVAWYSGTLIQIEVSRLIIGDLTLAILSILAVFLWMWYHVKSLWISCFSMMQIVLSLPVTFVIYRNVYQIPYLSAFHFLTIFLVLGIGADDVFVFVDGWRLAKMDALKMTGGNARDPRYLEDRMYAAYARTIEAVFNTSFTTIVAFLATIVSPLLPIQTFGVIAATAIFINFLFVITLTPAIVMTQYIIFQKNGFCGCCKKDDEESENGQVVAVKSAVESKGVKSGKSIQMSRLGSGPTETKELKEDGEPLTDRDGNEHKSEENFLEYISKHYYSPCMRTDIKGWHVVAVGVAIFFLVYGIVGISFAAQLSTPDDATNFLPDDHMFTKATESLEDDYLAGTLDRYVSVDFAFGIAGFDRSGFNRFIPAENRGKVVFQDTFDFYQTQSQIAFNTSCTLARQKGSVDGSDFSTLLHPDPEALLCFYPLFENWFNARNSPETPTSTTRTKFFTELQLYRNTTTSDGLSNADKQRLIGFIDGQLKFVLIETTSSLKQNSATKNKAKLKDTYTDLAGEMSSMMPTDSNSVFAAGSEFTEVTTEEGIVTGFFQGLAIVFPVAFVVLIIATHNILVSMYAILSIGFIVSCVLGLIKMAGGALGISESVAGVIVIGFSVDYVIHLGHMFVVAYHEEKIAPHLGRFTFAAETMAGTVIAGGITTLGAALPLFGCQLTFFPDMGALMATTIAFSLCYSIGFFMAILLLIGPDGDFTDLLWFAKLCGIGHWFGEAHSNEKSKKMESKEQIDRVA